MEYEHIRFEPGRVARLILNRPQYRNAQSRRMIEEMDDAFAAAVHDDAVRVIILSGAGGHFSAGHDLGTPEEKADRQSRGRDESEWDIRYERFYRTFLEATLRWRNLEKPTIAMVNPKPSIAAVAGSRMSGSPMRFQRIKVERQNMPMRQFL